MPIYEYSCSKCGCKVTEIQRIGEEVLKCLTCGGDMIKEVSSPALIRVKRGNVLLRSKGYKEGYSKEYLKDNPPSTEF